MSAYFSEEEKNLLIKDMPYSITYKVGTESGGSAIRVNVQLYDYSGALIKNPVIVKAVLMDPAGTAVEVLVANTGTTAFAATAGLKAIFDAAFAAGDLLIMDMITKAPTTASSSPADGTENLAVTITNDQAETVNLAIYASNGKRIGYIPVTFAT